MTRVGGGDFPPGTTFCVLVWFVIWGIAVLWFKIVEAAVIQSFDILKGTPLLFIFGEFDMLSLNNIGCKTLRFFT